MAQRCLDTGLPEQSPVPTSWWDETGASSSEEAERGQGAADSLATGTPRKRKLRSEGDSRPAAKLPTVRIHLVNKDEAPPAQEEPETVPQAGVEDGSPSDSRASTDPMAEEGTPSATGASTDPMAEEGTPSATGASTDPMAEEGTPSATGASTDPMAEEGTPSATGASTDPMTEEGTSSATGDSTDPVAEEGTPSATGVSTDGGPLCIEVADEQSVTRNHEPQPAGTPSARKGEGSDKQKAPHNSSTGEERPTERTKPLCGRKGVTKNGSSAAAPRPIFCDHPVIIEDLMQAGPARLWSLDW